MREEIKQERTSRLVLSVLERLSKPKLSKELGISRPTLDSRLRGSSKWKVLEMKWISTLYRKSLYL
jgi:hypothetical protein